MFGSGARTGIEASPRWRGALVVTPLVVALLAIAPSCDEPPSDRDRTVVAFVDDGPIYLGDLQRYLERNLVEVDGESTPNESTHAVKSRLLDALIEERLLIAEAERRGVRVTELEVRAYIELAAPDVGGTPADPDQESEARRRLMIDKLQDQVVREQPPVAAEEIRAYADQHRDRLLPRRLVELRTLKLRTLAEAERIRREIRRRRMTFREAVIAYEKSPGQGLPRRLSWNDLSEEIRRTLENLDPGQVSQPVELQGSVFLFQVVSWLRDPEDLEQELRKAVLAELRAERRRAALEDLLRHLHDSARVRIKTDALPFQYVANETLPVDDTQGM